MFLTIRYNELIIKDAKTMNYPFTYIINHCTGVPRPEAKAVMIAVWSVLFVCMLD